MVSATLVAMTPPLPLPDDTPMPLQESTFTDKVLLLLAAALNANAMLTYPEYELLQEVVRDIFGEKALHASLQAKLHYALLHPATEPEKLVASLNADMADVSPEQAEALLRGLDTLCDQREHMDHALQNLRESLAEASDSARRRQNNAFRNAASPRKLAGLSRQVLSKLATLAEGALQEPEGDPWGQLREAPNLPQTQTALTRYNARMRRKLENLERMAWTLEHSSKSPLRQALHEFRQTLHDQPFRVVFVGEGKRGKSTLVNALLGKEVSRVRESVPETGSVAEFFYSPHPHYTASFLDEQAFEHLDDYLTGEEHNLLLRDKVNKIRTLREAPLPAQMISLEDVPSYLSVSGPFTALTAKVSLGMPLEFLRPGLVLVDTPGLNATDAFHDYLAYEESLRADCLVFVMDARRPDSLSELHLLRKLAASGRAVSIIGVLTGADRLNEAASVQNALDRALLALQEACRDAVGLRVLGLISLNAREAMLAQCRDHSPFGPNLWQNLAQNPVQRLTKNFGQNFTRSLSKTLHALFDAKAAQPAPQQGEGLEALVQLLHEAMQADSMGDYKARVAARCDALVQHAHVHTHSALSRYRESLPPAQFLEMLDRHASQLAQAAYSHAEQAHAVIAAAAHDIDRWEKDQRRALDQWEERLVLRIMDAAQQHASNLGTAFAKEKAWKQFDLEEAPRIARQCLDEFVIEQSELQAGWEEKLRLFHEEMHQLSTLCLKAVEESEAVLGDICSTTGTMDHILVQTNAHMGRLAVFLAGTGMGGVLGGGIVNLIALGGAAIAVFTSPIMLPGALLLGAAVYALHSMGNPERRKEAFLARKRQKTEQWAAQARALLETELQNRKADIAANYKSAVSRGFVPALEILTGEATHLKLYLQVIDHMRADSIKYESLLNEELLALEGLSNNPSLT